MRSIFANFAIAGLGFAHANAFAEDTKNAETIACLHNKTGEERVLVFVEAWRGYQAADYRTTPVRNEQVVCFGFNDAKYLHVTFRRVSEIEIGTRIDMKYTICPKIKRRTAKYIVMGLDGTGAKTCDADQSISDDKVRAIAQGQIRR